MTATCPSFGEGLKQTPHGTSRTPVVLSHHVRLGTRVQRVLRTYAARLTAKLPKPASGQAQAAASVHSTDWHVRMEDGEVDIACTIVCTADYCQGVVGDLGASVARILDPPFGDQVASCCPEGLSGAKLCRPSLRLPGEAVEQACQVLVLGSLWSSNSATSRGFHQAGPGVCGQHWVSAVLRPATQLGSLPAEGELQNDSQGCQLQCYWIPALPT